VFVEFGCGKGRIVVDAARRYRFDRVIGVELSSELSTMARGVVARSGRLRCPDVMIENVDATAFTIPPAMSHGYLFNPFNGAIFQQVLDNIGRSLDEQPRRLRLIYVNPIEHDAVMATGRFRMSRRVRTTRVVSTVEAAIYETC
jgi:hypothetical protein